MRRARGCVHGCVFPFCVMLCAWLCGVMFVPISLFLFFSGVCSCCPEVSWGDSMLPESLFCLTKCAFQCAHRAFSVLWKSLFRAVKKGFFLCDSCNVLAIWRLCWCAENCVYGGRLPAVSLCAVLSGLTVYGNSLFLHYVEECAYGFKYKRIVCVLTINSDISVCLTYLFRTSAVILSLAFFRCIL